MEEHLFSYFAIKCNIIPECIFVVIIYQTILEGEISMTILKSTDFIDGGRDNHGLGFNNRV